MNADGTVIACYEPSEETAAESEESNGVVIANGIDEIASTLNSILQRVPGCSKEDARPHEEYKCHFCDKVYYKKTSWRKHLLIKHKLKPLARGSMKCPECYLSFRSHEWLRQHISSDHKIFLRMEEWEFTSLEDFQAWKAKVENEDNSLYRYYSKTKPQAKYLADVEDIRNYSCCRSSYLVYTNKKKKLLAKKRLAYQQIRPSQSCQKIDGICPSTMCVTVRPNKVEVEFWRTHFGHTLDSSHVHTRRSEKQKTEVTPDEDSRPPKVTYTCEFCAKVYSIKNSWRKHLENCHNLKPVIAGRIKCPSCPVGFNRLELLRKHISGSHAITLELEEWKFLTMDDFNEWKLKVERDTKSSYIRHSGSKAIKFGDNLTGRSCTFVCNRSDYYQKEKVFEASAEKKRKSYSCRKISGYCPSTMCIRDCPDAVWVEYWKTHYGHECEVKHLRIPKDEKKKIEAKLLAGFTPDQILEEIRTEAAEEKEPGRIHLIKKGNIDTLWKRLKEREQKGLSMSSLDGLDPWGWVDSVVELEDTPDETEKLAFQQKMESLNSLMENKALPEQSYKIINTMLDGCLNVFNNGSLELNSFEKSLREVVPEPVVEKKLRFELIKTQKLTCQPFVTKGSEDDAEPVIEEVVVPDGEIEIESETHIELDHDYSKLFVTNC